MNSGCLSQLHLNFEDKGQPLIVGSCGTHRLSTLPKLPTYHPWRRLDFQIICAASGCGHFHFDKPKNGTVVHAGNIVLCRPEEFQKYEYYGEGETGVYWVYFIRNNIRNILRKYGFADNHRIFPVDAALECEQIFEHIILGLQKCQSNYGEMMTLLLCRLLIIFRRELTKEHTLKNDYTIHEIDNAIAYSVEDCNRGINIEGYASSRGMSVSWFIRNFKKYTGSIPLQYIVSIRVNNTQTLLETISYAANKISRIVGYDNQLYFSHPFYRLKGYSPTEYRRAKRDEIL